MAIAIKKIITIASLLLLPLTAIAENKNIHSDFTAKIKALEQKNGGRLGVAALNTGNGERLGYKADQAFAMCSTFKLLLAADVLARVDAGSESLKRAVNYDARDILEYVPVTKKHLGDGKMTVAELSAAAIQYSDNTAANLLLKNVGGPEGVTQYLRSLGDKNTRLDRIEPNLNTNLPDDLRDSTTPSAMLSLMQKLLLKNILSEKSREQLNEWLMGNTTGDKRLRAGMKSGWKIGDKTGTCDNGAANDVAIVWPNDRKPFLITVYYSESRIPLEKKEAVIAEVGRITSSMFFEDR